MADADDLLTQLLEHSPHSIYVTDRAGCLRRANGRFLDALDMKWEHAAGRLLREIFPLEAHLQGANNEVMQRNRRVESEGATDLPGGPRFFRAIKFPLHDGAGQVESVGTILVDLTPVKNVEHALRQSEEKQRVISELTSDYAYTCTVDPDETIRVSSVSEGFRRVTGYTLEELRESGDWGILIHPEDMQRAQSVQDVLRAGQRVEQELRILTRDGQVRWVRYSCQPIRDAATGHVRQILGAVQDITQRKDDEDRLQAYAARLSLLSRRLIDVQEGERRHLARELHDEIGQVLTAVKITLERLRALATPTLRVNIEDSLRVVQQAIGQVRGMSLDLRPAMLDDFGLAPAVRWLAERQAELGGFTLHLDLPTGTAAPQAGRLSPELETTCYRVVQEALTNVVRHAQASRVVIELRHDRASVYLKVQDDGVGFSWPLPEAAHERFGLLGMQERVQFLNGHFTLRAEPGRGACVEVRLPVELAVPKDPVDPA